MSNQNEFRLKIKGQEWLYFNKFEVDLKYDSIASSFSFDIVFDPKDKNQLKLFKPLQYPTIEIWTLKELVITGTIMNTCSSIAKEISLISCAGYSKSGILEDCTIDLNQYPLQYANMNLKEITQQLCKPFGLGVIVNNGVDLIIKKGSEQLESNTQTNQMAQPEGVLRKSDNPDIATDEGSSEVETQMPVTETQEISTIKEFIASLCSQKNVILTHDRWANVVITKPVTNAIPVATYIEGIPTTKISLDVNGQEVHSKINIIRQQSLETDATGQEVAVNSLVNKYRPLTKVLNNGQNTDAKTTAAMVRGEELKSIKLTIETDRWFLTGDTGRKLIRPNNCIWVISPSNFMPKKTKWFIETVHFTATTEGVSAVLTCVLPETFTGATPQNIFKDE